ncbi:Hypothetical protein FKW44_000537 [Caligus rogercresseyi]|uniref:Uncharacterized protein n=1 Tax=Caligus rogercresseyi TaxID=217165 RepID=A0A7T8QUY5_CALRO|nr:Hypothetical protein FKW44_000537 [Caligus rogercresseyi]
MKEIQQMRRKRGGDDIDDSIQEEAASNVPPFADSLEDVIRKVRKIVKTFKKSPSKTIFWLNVAWPKD